MDIQRSASGSIAEDLFIELFSEAFGAEKAGYLYSQYHFYDIYQNSRYADFLLESSGRRVAIEIDDEGSHHKSLVASGKFYDDLLKQNSMIHMGWDVYRWAVRQMQLQPETVKDELRVFLGSQPCFQEVEDHLPVQRGRALDGASLELKEHQKEALEALRSMRERRETIALLCHATGAGKTWTAVMDAKRCGGRTLFLAHTNELVDQAARTFRDLWPAVTLGRYTERVKQPGAHVVCGSVQSVALHLEQFKDNAFDYLIIDEAHHAAADTYQKVLTYFKPKFTLGLTATPERMDGKSILEIFKNTAHKLDIQTAVELGELTPVRCIRIHTNIDLTGEYIPEGSGFLTARLYPGPHRHAGAERWEEHPGHLQKHRSTPGPENRCGVRQHEAVRAGGVSGQIRRTGDPGALRLRPAERGLGLPGGRGAVHGPAYHVAGALYPAAGAGNAAVRGQGEPDGLRLCGQRQPIQYAHVPAPAVQAAEIPGRGAGAVT